MNFFIPVYLMYKMFYYFPLDILDATEIYNLAAQSHVKVLFAVLC